MNKPFVPDEFEVPETVETEGFHMRMLSPDELDLDYEAVTSSLEYLKGVSTPPMCGDWPPSNLTKEQDLNDLIRHKEKHLAREIFAYTILNNDESQCLGCVYIFPSTKIAFDAEIYLRVRESEAKKGGDEKLYEFVTKWISQERPFVNPSYPGRSISLHVWDNLL